MLTIAISVLCNNDIKTKNLIINQINNFKKFLPKKNKYLIKIIYIIQCSNLEEFKKLRLELKNKTHQLNIFISFIYGGKSGVALSRNIAIKKSKTKSSIF